MRPLGRPAAETLRAALARHNGPFVFPGVRGSSAAGKPYGGLPKAWNRIKGAKGPGASVAEPLIASLTLHGLRHAFANVSDDFYSEATTAALLGHSRKGGGVTRGYEVRRIARLYDEDVPIWQGIATQIDRAREIRARHRTGQGGLVRRRGSDALERGSDRGP
jgi:integrase